MVLLRRILWSFQYVLRSERWSMLSRTAGRGFCKTEHLPYDAVVVGVLIAAEATGALTWESDGRDEDHAVGRRLAEGDA